MITATIIPILLWTAMPIALIAAWNCLCEDRYVINLRESATDDIDFVILGWIFWPVFLIVGVALLVSDKTSNRKEEE